jgi:hypothetical protein
MTKPPKTNRSPSRDDPNQSRAFIKKAQEIGANKELMRADDLMGKLAKLPPEPRTAPKKPAR